MNMYELTHQNTISEIYEFTKANILNCECCKDRADNIIIHKKGNGKKILLPFIIEKDELIITSVNDNKAYFLRTYNTEIENNAEVCNGSVVIGHILKKDDDFITLNGKFNPEKGDKLHFNPTNECKVNKLYGKNVKSDISLNIALNLILENFETDKDLYFTLSFSDKSAKVLSKSIKPDYIFTLWFDEASDKLVFDEGCGISYKDGGAITCNEVRRLLTECADSIKHQPYFGKSGSLTEYYSVSEKGIKTGSVIIPVKNMNKACEIVSRTDIEAAFGLFKNILTCEV